MAICSESLNILSICTGGGGLDLGVRLAIPGVRSVCMVERESFAVAHLVSAMEAGFLDAAPVWSDARTFDGCAWRGCVDGLIGGIPCQPHSLAGRKRGSHDKRDLWTATRRIIVQSRCWFVFIENVGGMLSAGADKIAGADRVWRDLQKLGYTVEAGIFTASEVGSPHERKRVFILGINAGLADTDSPRLQGWCDELGEYAGERHAWPPGPSDADGWKRYLRAAPYLEPSVCRSADGLAAGMDDARYSNRIDRLRMLGNGAVPLQAAYAVRTLAHRIAKRGGAAAIRLVRMMENDDETA